MADQTEELGIVIKADGTVELANGMKLTGEQISRLGGELDKLGKKLDDNAKAQRATGEASKGLGRDMGQAADKAVDLAKAAANGQWKEAAADLAKMGLEARGLTAGLMLGGTAVAALALVTATAFAASAQASKQQRELNEQLEATGNFAGLAGGQLDAMATKLAGDVKAKVSDSRDMLVKLTGSGRFTVESMASVGAAALLMQKLTGQSTDQVVNFWVRMSKDVARGAAEMNEQYHFLSFADYKRIEALQKLGDTQGALLVVSQKWATHLGGDLTRNMSAFGQTVDAVARKLDGWWAALVGRFNDPTTTSRLADSSKMLEQLSKGWLARTPAGQTRLRDEQQRNFELFRRGEREEASAFNQSARMAEEAAKIAKDREKEKSDKGAGGPDTFAANYIAQLQRQLRNLSGETSVYDDVLQHLNINAAKFSATQREDALSTARQIDARRALTTLMEHQNKTLAEEAAQRERAENAWIDINASMRQELSDRQFEISLIGKTSEQIARLRLERELEARMRKRRGEIFGDDTISKAEKDRRVAQLEQNNREQIIAGNDQLSEQFRPGWEKLLEGWGNTMQQVKDAHARAMEGVVTNGEQAFVEWVRTGKFSARTLVDAVIAEMARLYYRQNFASPLASFANGFISKLLGLGGGPVNLGTATGADWDIFTLAHTGGIVGSNALRTRAAPAAVFANAPRFHTGGIAGDEVPIIARKGEGIFTKEQMASLAPAGASGPQVNYTNVINIDARTDRAEVESLVGRAVRAGQADLLERLQRRT